MDTAEIKRAIADQFDILTRIEEELEESESYEASQILREKKQQEQYNLGKLQRELRAAEKVVADEVSAARLKAIAQFKADLYGYNQDQITLPELDEKMIQALEAFNTGLSQHQMMAGEFWTRYERLVIEARRLNQEEPARPHYNNGLIGPYLYRWLVENKMTNYVASLLRIFGDPNSRGPWVETGR